jgi:hypothetical protein
LTFYGNRFRRDRHLKIVIFGGMMRLENRCMWMIKSGLVLLFAISIIGCNFTTGSATPETAPSSSEAPEKSKKTTALYHDFEDVLVPMELTVMKDRTVVVSSPGFRSGILALKGRVDSNSLFNFFSNNMLKDNWNVVSKIKSPGTTIMVFAKTSRCAVITIRDAQVYTYVEIGVAPTMTSGMENVGGMTQMDLSE